MGEDQGKWLVWGQGGMPQFDAVWCTAVDGFDTELVERILAVDPAWVPPNDAELDDDELMDKLNNSWMLVVNAIPEQDVIDEMIDYVPDGARGYLRLDMPGGRVLVPVPGLEAP